MHNLIMHSEILKNRKSSHASMKQKSTSRYFVHSLEKGLSVLSAVAQKGAPVTLSELAELTNMAMPTAYRFARTLEDTNYLVQDQMTKKYSLSIKVLSLGFSVVKNMHLRSTITPYLSEITKEFNITSMCGILDGTEIVYIERMRANTLVSLDLTVGSRLPAYCTALGRAILAFMAPEKAGKLLDDTNLVPQTRHTITDKDALLSELAKCRKRGYSINKQELVLGQAAVGAPVFRGTEVVAALGASLPIQFLKKNAFEHRVVEKIVKIARLCSVE